LMLYRHRRRFLGDQILHVRHVSYLFVYDIYERLHLNAIARLMLYKADELVYEQSVECFIRKSMLPRRAY
jgi:hypothetical protein